MYKQFLIYYIKHYLHFDILFELNIKNKFQQYLD